MNCKKISLVVISFVFSISTFSQKNTVKVFDIKGFSIIHDNITPKQAKEEALLDAQRNALKSAGIEERLQSNMLLLKSSNNDTNFEFFSKEVQTQIEGSILDYEIKSTDITDLKVVVVIDATIIKYDTKPDLNFDVKLDGIKNNYNNNDKLLFTITTSMDSYLHLFSFIEDEATLMYPNSRENGDVLKKDKGYNFPFDKSPFSYELTAENKKNEKGRLIFVFTKKQMKYFQMDASQVTTPENIYTWINSIPLDQKKVITKPILIQY